MNDKPTNNTVNSAANSNTAHSDTANNDTAKNDKELADVVIAAQTHDEPFRPWYVTLRPWLFCLAFLLLTEMVTRIYFDTTLCLRTERFDNFPTAALENAFVAQMRRDKAYKVVMIGDSTIVGSALLDKSQTIPRYLEADLRAALPGREIHVWNFSMAGVRSSDMLSLLQKALEGHPDFIVMNGNYFIASMGGPPIAEPWLAYNLPTPPIPVAPLLPARDAKKRLEDNLTLAVEEGSRFIGLRQAICAMLFGAQPRVPWSVANPTIMVAVRTAKALNRLPMQPWYARGPRYQPQHFLTEYANPIRPDDNYPVFYGHIVREMQRSGLPCMTYLAPQNPAVTAYCVPGDIYKERRQVLSQAMTAVGVTRLDYSEAIPSELFNDNDHLMPEGNRMMAALLAREIAPRIRSVISAGEKPHPLASGR